MGSRSQLPIWTGFVAILIVTTFCAGRAQSFYFFGWPGSGIPPLPTVISPAVPAEANPPSAQPPVDQWPFEPGNPSILPEDPTSPKPSVPEPTTIISAMIGLGTLSVLRRLLKKA
jgi:hypothetical protein